MLVKEGVRMKTGEIIIKSRSESSILFRIYYSDALPGNRPYRDHHHAECEISAISSGSCEWQIGKKKIQCSKGDVLIFGSDEEHYITAISDHEPLKLMNIQFEPRFIWSPGNDLFDARYLGIFLNHRDGFQNKISAASEAAQKIFALMMQIRQECNGKEPEYPLIVKAELMLILGLLGRHYAGSLLEPPVYAGGYLQQLEDALDYIDNNLIGDLTLDAIADSAGMSRSHFSSVFKKMNGLSVWDYITKKRIQLAMTYIQQGKYSITQTAMLCGYNTMANFNRSFKMVTHCTPSQFRKEFARERETKKAP